MIDIKVSTVSRIVYMTHASRWVVSIFMERISLTHTSDQGTIVLAI